MAALTGLFRHRHRYRILRMGYLRDLLTGTAHPFPYRACACGRPDPSDELCRRVLESLL